MRWAIFPREIPLQNAISNKVNRGQQTIYWLHSDDIGDLFVRLLGGLGIETH